MRAILEVKSGPSAGQKRLLRGGQVLHVGRTERADLAVPCDTHMSAVHFSFEAGNAACYVKDLGSRNGTSLNGSALSGRAIVHDGDTIQAGQTVFAVHIEGAGSPELDATATPSTEVGDRRGRVRAFYERVVCPSQLVVFSGSIEQCQPAALAELLGQVAPMYLIVDLTKLDKPLGKEEGEPQYLMDWLPEEVRKQHSPAVCTPADGMPLPSLLAAAWGKDGAIALFSDLEPHELLGQLRPSAGAFARPSLLAPQLSQTSPDFAKTELMADIQAVLIEDESPDRWRVFADEEFEPTLQKLGLKPGHDYQTVELKEDTISTLREGGSD